MADAVNRVRRDYHAVHNSGTRPVSSIRYFVIHASEAPQATAAAEIVGRYFESKTSRGSTQYGIDVDSTQQYAKDNVICWGAPPLNDSGLHVECAGKTSLGRHEWLRVYGPMFKRLGWLIANRCKAYNIPTQVLSVSELKTRGQHPKPGHGGIVTHATVSAAWKQSDHTDPGSGFPMDVVLAWVHVYKQGWIKANLSKPVLHIYCKGKWVKRLQNDLTALGYYKGAIDGDFGKATEWAVKKLQREHFKEENGVVGLAVWKVLEK